MNGVQIPWTSTPEYHPEAREAFEAAAAADGATLATHMGPQVAPLARQHLDSLR